MKSINKYTLLIALTTCFFACEDTLDLKPEATLTEAAFWKTPADFKQAANEFYFDLPRAQDMTTLTSNSDFETDETIDEISSGINIIPTSDGRWGGAYGELRDINILLAKATSFEDQNAIEQYIGEAHFFRAWQNYELLKIYGAYIIVKDVLDVSSPELSSPLNSREECADNIIEDLELAIPMLPLESEIPAGDKGRISKQGAQAFLARVALFEGTWQKFRGNTERGNALLDIAISNSNSVITAGEHELFKGLGDESYRWLFLITDDADSPGGFSKSDLKEHVLVSKYDVNLRRPSGNISHAMNSFHQSPTRKLADMYLCEDGLPISQSPLYKGGDPSATAIDAEYLNRDLRMTNSFKVPGLSYCPKGDCSVNDPVIGTSTITGYNWIKFVSQRSIENGDENYDFGVIRYAEVLLIYAEALFERDGSISDADLEKSINVVRNRVNLPDLTNAFITSNGLDMRTEIRRERNVELAAEGHRLLDLKRWKTAEVEMPMSLLGTKITGTDFESDTRVVVPGLTPDGYALIQDASTRQWTEKNYIEPLPADELNLNRSMSQFPEWGGQ